MRVPRFYQDDNLSQIYSAGSELELSVKNHRHAVQVLRLKCDEKLIIFDGKGGEYSSHIKALDKRKSSVVLDEYNDVNRESPVFSVLILALIKPDKMDIAIQKAVELGVNTIQPIYSERSVIKIKADRLEKKIEHWRGIVLAACEQSGRTAIPEINAPKSFSEALEEHSKKNLCIAMLPKSSSQLKDLSKEDPSQAVSIFIGPEGGFTNNEEQQMLEKEISGICFGPRILRAETAVISAITAVQQRWGDC